MDNPVLDKVLIQEVREMKNDDFYGLFTVENVAGCAFLSLRLTAVDLSYRFIALSRQEEKQEIMLDTASRRGILSV